MRKVVVTGATGFIGKNLWKLLPGLDVQFYFLCRNAQKNSSTDNIHFVKCDVLDYTQVKNAMMDIKPSHLLHLAWGMSPSDYNLPENFEWLKASINLLEEFHKNDGRRAIVAGSCIEYSWDQAFCIEAVTTPSYSTLYGASKNILKDYATTYCKNYEVELAWIRPFFLFGPHENPKRLLPQIILPLLKGEKAIVMNGEIYRDYMYVKDAVKIISEMIFSEFTGQINIATGIPVKLGDLGKMVAASIGKEELLEVRTPEVKSNRVVFGSTKKLQEQLHFEFTPLQKGLDDTIAWWRSEMSKINYINDKLN